MRQALTHVEWEGLRAYLASTGRHRVRQWRDETLALMAWTAFRQLPRRHGAKPPSFEQFKPPQRKRRVGAPQSLEEQMAAALSLVTKK